MAHNIEKGIQMLQKERIIVLKKERETNPIEKG